MHIYYHQYTNEIKRQNKNVMEFQYFNFLKLIKYKKNVYINEGYKTYYFNLFTTEVYIANSPLSHRKLMFMIFNLYYINVA